MKENTQLKEIQKIELSLLKAFHKVCEENNLKYFLIGGTLLGAVRHKGFIPWDDDIDVGMPREDYELLLQNADKWFPSDYKLRNWKNTVDYPYNFAKLEDQNTILVENFYRHLTKRKSGIYIDVFPFDGISSNPVLSKLHFYLNYILKSYLIPYLYIEKANIPCKTSIKQLLKYIMVSFIQKKLSKKKSHYFFDKILKIKPYKNSTNTINFLGAWGYRELTSKDILEKEINLVFEKNNFKAFKDFDIYLSRIYDNYMKLPPINKRVSHHSFTYSIINKTKE